MNISIKKLAYQLLLLNESLLYSLNELDIKDNAALSNLKLYISQMTPEASKLSVLKFESQETWETFHKKIESVCEIFDTLSNHIETVSIEFKRILTKKLLKRDFKRRDSPII